MTRPSFSRILLPLLAALGIVVAAVMVFAGSPIARGSIRPRFRLRRRAIWRNRYGVGVGGVEPSTN